MEHALVVGGSGMLAEVSLWLANQDHIVSVVGRSAHKLQCLTELSDRINPISVDYTEEAQFRRRIRDSVAAYGPYDVVVAWMHSHEKLVIDCIGQAIRDVADREWRLFHVLGSRSNLDEIRQEIDTDKNCRYHQVQLGFLVENDRSRWLTHDEIAQGVIRAVSTNTGKYVVGTLTPWDQRPL